MCRTLSMAAPIMESGSMIRFMGRVWIEESPVSVQVKGCAARIPEIRRVVVPLFPASSTEVGACSP